jgi:hypothetical protein
MPSFSDSEESEYDYGGCFRKMDTSNKKIVSWDVTKEKGFQHISDWAKQNKT